MYAWSGKKEFAKLSGELAVSERLDFQRRVLPLLHVVWPEALTSPTLRSFDRAGADHLVWADREPLPLVVQCKGFEASEHELGAAQAAQCVRSIAAFRDGGLRARRYLLVHNRDARNPEFRDAVQAELRRLVDSGRVEVAELWDRQTLLRKAFDRMLERTLAEIRHDSLSLAAVASDSDAAAILPLEQVPVRASVLVADQFRLHATSPPVVGSRDPASFVAAEEGVNPTVLIGEFGFGKTTAVTRAVTGGGRHILLVPGATFAADTAGVKDFLFQCIDRERLMADFPAEDRRTLRLLIRPALQYLLGNMDLQAILIIDGLDESAFLSRSGGMQTLFNILQPVQVPVFLSMRTEFWSERVAEFATVIGKTGPPDARRNRRIRLVELLPWTATEITLFLERHRDAAANEQERARLGALVTAVASGEFEHLFGDIPRRPLFLKFIVDSVAARGLPAQGVGKAGLFRDWAQLKILRDAVAPQRVGGARAAIVNDAESSASRLEVAWEAMLQAAGAMTEVRQGAVELLASCPWEEVRAATSRLATIVDPTGLFLHSLVLPLADTGHPARRLRFAHRSFQEYFLAWFVLEHPQRFAGLTLPAPIREWMGQIRAEGLVGAARTGLWRRPFSENA